MSTKLKSLDQQVIVITGASSGIGLATAEAAAKKGAKLALAARSEQTMNDVVARINDSGGEAIFVACDVADRAQVESVAKAAVARFGRIDTWVNNAGIAIYGRLDEVTDEDSRRLFETNFWGVVNGSLAALPHLQENGGALINLGSEVSDAVVPLLGMYSASKHAVKGFTDSLRVEIEDVDKSPYRSR
ncbi:MAG TPA: SDR family NAD(P)-dependent oxidoreductase [Tepidisphaeraceae bacterium]|jgi:NADP-dependent 3-hydroxy acid dehydrogenase YdfG|nr:SDR family NAD(P)-dependent oxidoreductase [Tepidisphaeraceae bacterium]